MPLARLAGIEKTYNPGRPNEVRALKGVELTIEGGETVAIMGRSGAGKSTLLHIMGCLDRPTAGTYRIRGDEVDWRHDAALARLRNRRLGFVFQEFALINGQTAWQNAMLPLVHRGMDFKRAEERARELLVQVGLVHRIDHRVEEMSGGERQRVAIARALINDPDLILADEPTGSLDATTEEEILGMLLDLATAERSVVIVTHNAQVASRCARVLTLDEGRLEAAQSAASGFSSAH